MRVYRDYLARNGYQAGWDIFTALTTAKRRASDAESMLACSG